MESMEICPSVFNKDEDYPQRSSLRYKQVDLGLFSYQEDHNYGAVPFGCSQERGQFPAPAKMRNQANENWISEFIKKIEECVVF